jgi:hypothetical protein
MSLGQQKGREMRPSSLVAFEIELIGLARKLEAVAG